MDKQILGINKQIDFLKKAIRNLENSKNTRIQRCRAAYIEKSRRHMDGATFLNKLMFDDILKDATPEELQIVMDFVECNVKNKGKKEVHTIKQGTWDKVRKAPNKDGSPVKRVNHIEVCFYTPKTTGHWGKWSDGVELGFLDD